MTSKTLKNIIEQRPNDRKVILFGPSYFAGIMGHLQALKLIEESGIDFDTVYGSHLGAIIATAYAYKIDYQKLLYFLFHDLSKYNVFDLRIREFLGQTFRMNPLSIEGICYGRNLSRVFESLLKLRQKHFQQPSNLYLFSEHFNLDKLKMFHVPDEIEPHTALRAATAITAVFPPVKIRDQIFIDSGLFGGLPLSHIYEKEKGLSRKRKPSLTIVAFQEAFTSSAKNLSLLDRLIYSFNEKVRYHSTNIDLEESRRLPIRLILISFNSGNLKHQNLINLNKSEKWGLMKQLDEDIARQIDYYHQHLSPRQRKCTPYPIAK